jgi:ferrochelatase
MVEDAVREMARDGVRRALVLATSAYGGYSACRLYHEDIARARNTIGGDAPELVKLRHFFDHPGFVTANADAVRAARATLAPQLEDPARLVIDHIEALHAVGVSAVITAPVGFVSDHVEVIWDLDTEAADRAAELGMGFARAATAGSDPRFADMVVELIAEHVDSVPERGIGSVARAGCTVNGAPCAVNCCAPAPRPGPDRVDC